MTTPNTPGGKVLTIFYGFFGCAAVILFFNLFLERFITAFINIIKILKPLLRKLTKKQE